MHADSRRIRFWVWSVAGLLVLSIGMLSALGCETMEGAGKDLENAGESVQDAAN